MTTGDELRAAAAREAESLGASTIASEHLFLAWLAQTQGAAVDHLTTAGLTAESFRAQIAGRPAASTPPGEAGGLSTHAQRALTLAQQIAREDSRVAVDGDDVLLALIREPRGPIARAFTQSRVKPSQLRALVRPRSAPRPAPQAPPAPPPRSIDRPAQAPRSRPRPDPEIDHIPEARAPERPKLNPAPRPAVPRTRRWRWTWLLLVAVPISLALRFTGADPVWVFVTSCIGIVPLAALLATATEQIADRAGPMAGALVNAAFGNATEVIVAIAALSAGYIDLVKASIIGSILGNLLLILGLALLTAGRRQSVVKFNRTAAGMSAAMLALAVAALLLPSLMRGTAGEQHVVAVSHLVAGILAAVYLASLLFTLRTHRQLLTPAHQAENGAVPWPLATALGLLAVVTIAVAVESRLLVDTIVPVTRVLGISELFLGLIVIPIIGNAAEHATAVLAARNGRTELSLQIALGSSTQVALLVAPLLVLVGALMGREMDLVFPMFQVAALGIGVVVSAFITLDGESHWLEGVQLLALYAMIAVAAWFI